jgi:hypothetical protein
MIAMALLRALLLTGFLATGACVQVGAGAGSPPSQSGLAGLRPRVAPESWSRARLPAQGVALWIPGQFRSVPADVGALSRAVGSGPAYRLYVNVTPNSAAVEGFPAARIDHQREEELDVHVLGSAPVVTFHGGRGACVADDYVTRVGAHHYQEISCLVAGRHGTVEVVTAALTSHWNEEAGTFRRILESLVLA